MKKEFVTYEQALKLKELRFNEKCLGAYIWLNGSKNFQLAFYKDRNINFNTTSNIYVSAPLKQQVFSWFRKKGYDVKLQREYNDLYFGFYWTGVAWLLVSQGTYDEAESELIDKLIDIAKK
jgi:hypothetical protein